MKTPEVGKIYLLDNKEVEILGYSATLFTVYYKYIKTKICSHSHSNEGESDNFRLFKELLPDLKIGDEAWLPVTIYHKTNKNGFYFTYQDMFGDKILSTADIAASQFYIKNSEGQIVPYI